MGVYAGIILAVLKFVEMILSNVNQKKWFDAGHGAAVAEQTRRVLDAIERGKKVAGQVDAIPDDKLDDAFRDLEPK